MGANKILVISNRQSSQPSDVDVQYESGISFANLFGQMLNALFLDNLDRDIRQIQHINQATNYLSSEEQESLQWHSVDVLAIKPSEDIGALASKKKSLLPKTLRYLLGSLGERKQLGDILSFLLFDGRFCRELIELGFSDAMQNKDDIKQFFD